MTIEEAREHIGSRVVYQISGRKQRTQGEAGVITRVDARFVWVAYEGDSARSKATYAADLQLLEGEN